MITPKEERIRCIHDICHQCRDGNPTVWYDVVKKYVHEVGFNGKTIVVPCFASAIHERVKDVKD